MALPHLLDDVRPLTLFLFYRLFFLSFLSCCDLPTWYQGSKLNVVILPMFRVNPSYLHVNSTVA